MRGLDNLSKRHQIAAASYNLSQLLRHLHGVGTPKQWVALLFGVIIHLLRSLLRRWQALVSPEHHLSSINPFNSLLADLPRSTAINLIRGALGSRIDLEITDSLGAKRSLRLRRDQAIPAEDLIGTDFNWNWHGAWPEDFMNLTNYAG